MPRALAARSAGPGDRIVILMHNGPVLGERAHAGIVNQGDVSAADLTALCRERLSDYKAPETYTIRDTPLPRNANGKIDKRALRKQILPTLPLPE